MYRVLILLLVVFTFSACGGDATSNESGKANAAGVSTNPAAPVKKHYESSHEAPYCKLWIVQHAIGAPDMEDYKGRWFNLKTDGSFESGKWDATTNNGTWSIEQSSNIISLNFKSPETIPSNWAIQGAGGGGRILFKGNVSGNPKGLQVMLEPDTVLPVKPAE